MSGEVRLRQLEQFILDGPAQTNGQCFSVETLLDILICLYDECNNSPLRREKNILEYLEWVQGFFFSVVFVNYFPKSAGMVLSCCLDLM
uniref:CDC42 binding protein kinase alpha n=1 Tax=Ovis aries TaxID=9940 RepID=A0AC11D2K5_SHEEP